MAYVKTPMFQKSNYAIPIILKQQVHKGDIYTIDIFENFAATGGVDNRVCVWNSLAGAVRSYIEMPRANSNLFICQVKFVKTRE